MIIVSSLQFAGEEKNRPKLSKLYPQYAELFSNYTSNANLVYRFVAPDLHVRSSFPSNLDIAINIWIIGMCEIYA